MHVKVQVMSLLATGEHDSFIASSTSMLPVLQADAPADACLAKGSNQNYHDLADSRQQLPLLNSALDDGCDPAVLSRTPLEKRFLAGCQLG